MSVLLALILAPVCAISVSALAIPPATTPIWDPQRATSFKALLVEATHHVPTTESNTSGIERTPMPSVIVVESKTTTATATASQVRRSDPVTKVPSGGMQCVVM
jgi:hypothetical protein